MTLVISKANGGIKLLNQLPSDADATAYFSRVEGASGDNQALEAPVKFVIANFILGCKADGIWDAIKASCILCGARTLNGALQPLVGTAPTNNNFVSGDYNRKTGLIGNGSTKYLNSNRNNNTDPQNNFHIMTMVSSFGNSSPASSVTAGAGGSSTGRTVIAYGVATSRSTTASSLYSPITPTAIATSRSSSSQFTVRVNGVNNIATVTSQTPGANAFYLFARENGSGGAELYTDCRLAFYSIGESLNLALLDARVTELINNIQAVTP